MADFVKDQENTDQHVDVPSTEVAQESQPINLTQGDDDENKSNKSEVGSDVQSTTAVDEETQLGEESEYEEDEEVYDEETSAAGWEHSPPRPKYSKVEELQRKATMLHQLKKLTESGRYSTIELTMADPIEDIETELFRIKGEKQNEDSLDFAKKAFLLGIQGLEMVSKKQNVVDLDLDGLSTCVSCDSQLGKYDEVLMELVEKYGASASAGPEVKLVLMLVTSAFGVHVSNKAGKQVQQQASSASRPPPSINRPSLDIASVLKTRQPSPSPLPATPDFEREVPSTDELVARMNARKRQFEEDDVSSVGSKRSRRSWTPSPPRRVSPPPKIPTPPPPPPMQVEEPKSVAMEDILAQPDDASVIAPVAPKKKRAPRKPKEKPPTAEVMT